MTAETRTRSASIGTGTATAIRMDIEANEGDIATKTKSEILAIVLTDIGGDLLHRWIEDLSLGRLRVDGMRTEIGNEMIETTDLDDSVTTADLDLVHHHDREMMRVERIAENHIQAQGAQDPQTPALDRHTTKAITIKKSNTTPLTANHTHHHQKTTREKLRKIRTKTQIARLS